MKQELLAIVKEFTVRAEHPGADLLKSTLQDISKYGDKQKQADDNSGTQTLWIGAALKIANGVMNFADGIGTYSDKVSR